MITPSTDSPGVKTILTLYDAFHDQDRDHVRELFHPEIEWIQNEGMPHGGHWRGPDEIFTNVFDRFREHWTGFRAEIEEVLDAGERDGVFTVIALGWYTGTFNATGRPVRAALAHVYRIREGRVIRFDQYTDTAMVREAVGT